MLVETIISDLKHLTAATDEIEEQKIQIKLSIIEKSQILYATDGNSIMQIKFCSSQKTGKLAENQSATPFNRYQNSFYALNPKHAKFFNFCSDNSYPQMKYPHAYTPHFYFGKNFDYFVGEKEKIVYKVFDELVIKRWKTKVINLSNSGYYGVILEIYEYVPLKKNKNGFTDLKNLNFILYDEGIAEQLLRIRLEDMRKQFNMKKQEDENEGLDGQENNFSMCYYMRNIRVSTSGRKNSPFIIADKQSRILKTSFDPEATIYFIPLGNLAGVYRFIRPLLNLIKNYKNQETHINFQKLNTLVEKRDTGVIQIDIESSEEESEDLSAQHQLDVDDFEDEKQNQEERFREFEDNSSDDEDEPLRLLYKKQMANMKIV